MVYWNKGAFHPQEEVGDIPNHLEGSGLCSACCDSPQKRQGARTVSTW